MYSQFFGNYLLSEQAVTTDQLVHAIQEQHTKHLRLGTLAMHAGLLTALQVDNVVIRQTHEDRLFGEIAIEEGLLTEEQVEELLNTQTPDYLLIGQTLVDDGVFTNSDLDRYIKSYQKENEISQLESDKEQQENLEALVRNLFLITLENVPEYVLQYLNLLFNNLLRFIGEDFTPLNPSIVSEFVTGRCSSQVVRGDFQLTSYFDMTEDAAIAFASRYVNDSFTEYDEYVQASVEDFLNLHNGLFNVNISNNNSEVELQLEPPISMDNTMISCSTETILLPIIYPFGIINLLISISESENSVLPETKNLNSLESLNNLEALMNDLENMS